MSHSPQPKKSSFLKNFGYSFLGEIIVFIVAMVLFTSFALPSLGTAYAYSLALVLGAVLGGYYWMKRVRRKA